jgi:predicted ATPase/DNA-binding NarL/FixJ family response regulator
MTAHALPVQLTSFVGREVELAEITHLLSEPSCRLLTLTGPGGIGKTRLAIEVARQTSFSNGAYFVALQPLTSPDFIISTIAASLNYTFFGEQEPKTQLLNYLREQSLLLVLDNFEHLLEGADLLPEILETAPSVKLLVTSRERLRLREEWMFDVRGLSFPDDKQPAELEAYSAIELFMQSARRVGYVPQATDKTSIIGICQLVEGMPLAIELAAAWVRVMPCAAIAREIERSLDILTTTTRNIPEKHRSMHAAFEHSWILLSEEEQAVFRKLSVFRGGFTREAAEEVAGASLAILASLVDKSLLRVDATGRCTLHELLRQFADDQLDRAGEIEAVRDAHNAYYTRLLEQRWRPMRSYLQVRTLDEIDIELENIRTAWQRMVEKRDTTQLSVAVYPFWYYCDLRGRYHDALALFNQAQDVLRSEESSPEVERVIAQMMTRRGFLYVSLGKPEEGRALAADGLETLQRVGTVEDLVLGLDSICLTSLWIRDFHTQKENAEQAVQLAKRTDDRWLLARSTYWLADAVMYLAGNSAPSPDFESAQRLGEEALDLAEACGDLWLRALASGEVLGGIALSSGDYAEKRRRTEQSLTLFEQLGQPVTIAQTHWGIGVGCMGTSDYSAAAYHYLQSLKILSENKCSFAHQIRALLFITDVWRAQGARAEAVELLTLCLHHRETLAFSRKEAEQRLREIQTEVLPQMFAAAQQRGRQLELQQVVKELLRELPAKTDDPQTQSNQSLFDPLTRRELEILRLVASGLSNREIAEALVLAPSTVKWYVSELLSKLEVTNRTQAGIRARELGLLS